MVNSEAETRAHPTYDLDRVRELADAGRVRYASSRTENDIENLGYSPELVQRCLSTLEATHFQKSIRYEGKNFWLDVYRREFITPDEWVDELLIKLKLDRSCVTLILESFHQPRYE